VIGFELVGAAWVAVLTTTTAIRLHRWHRTRARRRQLAARATAIAEFNRAYHHATQDRRPGTDTQLLADCEAIWNETERRHT
jgi:hypothetical protein